MNNVTDRQRQILRHALGLNYQDTPYRNHFVTGPGSDDYDDCCALVDKGLMARREGNEISGGDTVFMVTLRGTDAA